jgi:hypothetical protein
MQESFTREIQPSRRGLLRSIASSIKKHFFFGNSQSRILPCRIQKERVGPFSKLIREPGIGYANRVEEIQVICFYRDIMCQDDLLILDQGLGGPELCNDLTF